MSNVDWIPELAAALDGLVPLEDGSRADWDDVVARLGTRRKLRLGRGRHRRLRLAIVVALLFLLLTGAATATYLLVHGNRQDAVFRRISVGNIRDLQTQINGSSDARNQIPTGTVLVYKTSAGNLGKMQILRYGYNLRVRWVTYRRDGTVLSSGKNLLIRGTYIYDLDYGIETNQNDPTADLWWEQATNRLRYLVAMNGASFTIASYSPCELTKTACQRPVLP